MKIGRNGGEEESKSRKRAAVRELGALKQIKEIKCDHIDGSIQQTYVNEGKTEGIEPNKKNTQTHCDKENVQATCLVAISFARITLTWSVLCSAFFMFHTGEKKPRKKIKVDVRSEAE